MTETGTTMAVAGLSLPTDGVHGIEVFLWLSRDWSRRHRGNLCIGGYMDFVVSCANTC